MLADPSAAALRRREPVRRRGDDLTMHDAPLTTDWLQAGVGVAGVVVAVVLVWLAFRQMGASRQQAAAAEAQVEVMRSDATAERHDREAQAARRGEEDARRDQAVRDQLAALASITAAMRDAARAQVQPIVFANVHGPARRGPDADLDLGDGEVAFPYFLTNEGPGVALSVKHGVEVAGVDHPFGGGMEFRTARPGEFLPPLDAGATQPVPTRSLRVVVPGARATWRLAHVHAKLLGALRKRLRGAVRDAHTRRPSSLGYVPARYMSDNVRNKPSPLAPQPTRRHQLEMTLITANEAMRAVDHQAYRLRHPVPTPAFDGSAFQSFAEARFLIVAIRWVQQACALVAELLDDHVLGEAVAEVWKATGVGSAKDMRDVWEHFDAYIVGAGRLQTAGRRPDAVAAAGSLGAHTWTGAPNSLGSVHWAGLSVSLDASVAAARDVYTLVVDAARTRVSDRSADDRTRQARGGFEERSLRPARVATTANTSPGSLRTRAGGRDRRG